MSRGVTLALCSPLMLAVIGGAAASGAAARTAATVSDLRVSAAARPLPGDHRLLATISPNGDGHRDAVAVRFPAERTAAAAEAQRRAAVAPALPPRIVFARGGALYAVDPAGAQPVRLTPDDGRWYGRPAASRDGRRLAYFRYDDPAAGDWAGGLHVAELEGQEERRVASSSWGSPATGVPLWSPGGRRLAFWRLTRVGSGGLPSDECAEVAIVDVATGRERQLAATPEATWSPDGTRLAYVAEAACYRNPRIVVRAVVGGPVRVLGTGRSPDWSRRGGRIAFVRGGDLFTVHVPSGRQARVTAGRALDGKPRWSPDGRRIAFVRSEPRRCTRSGCTFARDAVFVVEPGRSTPRRIGPWRGNAPSLGRPSWSPDGTRLAWAENESVVVAAARGSGYRRLAAGNSPTWVQGDPDGAVGR